MTLEILGVIGGGLAIFKSIYDYFLSNDKSVEYYKPRVKCDDTEMRQLEKSLREFATYVQESLQAIANLHDKETRLFKRIQVEQAMQIQQLSFYIYIFMALVVLFALFFGYLYIKSQKDRERLFNLILQQKSSSKNKLIRKFQ